jgi:hypothetical protein
VSESCANCYYARVDGEVKLTRCHRNAPKSVNSFRFYNGEALRDIAWSLQTLAKVNANAKEEDFLEEATEYATYAGWPEVEEDDWCGEWRNKNETPNQKTRRLNK